MYKPSLRQQSYSFICSWILPFGFLALLMGLAVLPERHIYHKLFYALIAAPCLAALLLSPARSKSFWTSPTVICFLLFASWALISINWSTTDNSPSSLVKRPLYILMLFAAATLLALEPKLRLGKTVLLAGLLLAPITLLALFEFAANHTPEQRFIGTGALDNPLLSSHFFGFFFTIWLALSMTITSKQARLAVIPALVMGAALLATGSRTPLAASCLTCAWLIFACWNRRGLWLVAAALLTLAAVLWLSPELISNRGLSYRPELWSRTLSDIATRPWLGFGFDAHLAIYLDDLQITFTEPHSFILGVLYDTGIIGLLLWIAIHLTALWQCWNNRHNYLFVVGGALLVYGLGAGLSEGGGLISRPKEHWFLVWIPLAFIIALSVRQQSLTAKQCLKKLSSDALLKLTQDAIVLEQDGLGPKVLKLTDKSFLKLFRKRPLLSKETVKPYGLRFAQNAECLKQLGFISPEISCVYRLDDAVNHIAVHYIPLPGQTLRQALSKATPEQQQTLVEQFGELLAQLHVKGVYFRSAHLGNILQLPDGKLGLIDLADMHISYRPIPVSKRLRNLKHIQRYAQDRQWLFSDHLRALQTGYARIDAPTATKLFSNNADNPPG